MAAIDAAKKDHWSSQAYKSAANFVPKLTSTVISYLDVQPHDHILDIGCGDGQLTVQIAQAAHDGAVLGVDSSASFIETAARDYSVGNCAYTLHDGRHLESCPEVVTGTWDKVFSNAAMHWILRDEQTRVGFFHNVARALKPQGKFVFEMGGHGNVAEVHAAIIAAMRHAGVEMDRVREANPWYFPAPDEISAMLASAGFLVEKCYLEYRPTKLTVADDTGAGGIEGWVRLMGAQFLDAAPESKRDTIVQEVCQVLEPVITRHDGSKWIGYVRLRGIATRD